MPKLPYSVAQDKPFFTISKLPTISGFQNLNEDLPPNWEARLDAHGRVFYVDHDRRTTTWIRPQVTPNCITPKLSPLSRENIASETDKKSLLTPGPMNQIATTAFDNSTEQHRTLLNRRYTLRRTISNRRPQNSEASSSGLVDPSTPDTSIDTALGTPFKGQDSIDGNCMSGPAVNRSYNSAVESTSLRQASTSSSLQSPQTQAVTIILGDSNQAQPAQVSRPKLQLSPSISCPPALKFLNRSDFFNLLHLNDEALMLYNTSTNLKYIINKVRKDQTNYAYERFQHNKDLVAFLNKFTLKDKPLPLGWEAKLDEQRKCFFIDHLRKTTTYVDPRLPTELPLINPCQVPIHPHRTPGGPSSASSSSANNSRVSDNSPSDEVTSMSTPDPTVTPVALAPTANTSNISQDPSGPTSAVESSSSTTNGVSSVQPIIISYQEKVVAFFKQPHVIDIIKSKRSASGLVSAAVRDKINQIRKGGVSALKKYDQDVNLIQILSLFDSEIDSMSTVNSASSRSSHVAHSRGHVGRMNVPGKRDFEEKLRCFYRKLEQKNYAQGPNKLKLSIRRDHILEDAFTKVMSVNSKKELQRLRLYVCFAGEEGLDYGGPSREFFFLLSRELFNPYYGKYGIFQPVQHVK